MFKKSYTFDDMLLEPNFSTVRSRADVDLSTELFGDKYKFPLISANMASITESEMAVAMADVGGIGALHRFQSIEDNVKMFNEIKNLAPNTLCSFGIGEKEKERAEALVYAGCNTLILDVAHGASIHVADQVKWFKYNYTFNELIVGNFANKKSIDDFQTYTNYSDVVYKLGIGSSKICSTRLKSGCGGGQLSILLECSKTYNIISDGGAKYSGDIVKALACGAKMVMTGGLLAATEFCPGPVIKFKDGRLYKRYTGSACTNHNEGNRTAEGVSTLLNYKGSTIDVLKDIEGGIRSGFSYVGAHNLTELVEKATFIEVSSATISEGQTYKDEY